MRNNVNTEAIYGFEKEIYNNLSVSEKEESISGSWNFDNEVGQFKAHVKSEFGNAIMLSDNKTSLGGNGVQPSPMQYILFGIASGFVGALVNKAALNNYHIQDIKVKAVASTNYDMFFSIEERNPVEKLTITANIYSDEDVHGLLKLKNDIMDCCPPLSLIKKDNIEVIINVRKSS
ncbi:MAG TPA: hypothetical protein DHV28_04015 [Ignavibacteriales bacterium]|nr:hypothetical protein [Ignavibacteriaceae bacterium]HCY75062.1 hypothetical protein [Ignavibacteriales bacterium]